MDFTAEISGNMLENEEDLNEDHMAKVEALKVEKRKLKGAITRQRVWLLASAVGLNQEVLKKLKKLKQLWSVWKTLRKKLSKYWKNYGRCIRS